MGNPWRKARLQFQKELYSNASGVNKSAQQIFVNATSSFLDYVQMNKELLPYDTANLHDSIATSVSLSGRIVRANYMPTEATRPQHAPGRKRIVGALEAERAVRQFHPNRTGVFATLFVAVPYADGANIKSHHPGFYEWLTSAFEQDMTASMNVLERYPNAKPVPALKRRFEK